MKVLNKQTNAAKAWKAWLVASLQYQYKLDMQAPYCNIKWVMKKVSYQVEKKNRYRNRIIANKAKKHQLNVATKSPDVPSDCT